MLFHLSSIRVRKLPSPGAHGGLFQSGITPIQRETKLSLSVQAPRIAIDLFTLAFSAMKGTLMYPSLEKSSPRPGQLQRQRGSPHHLHPHTCNTQRYHITPEHYCIETRKKVSAANLYGPSDGKP